nr:hypothetical protein [Caballeronia sp. GACF5]
MQIRILLRIFRSGIGAQGCASHAIEPAVVPPHQQFKRSTTAGNDAPRNASSSSVVSAFVIVFLVRSGPRSLSDAA